MQALEGLTAQVENSARGVIGRILVQHQGAIEDVLQNARLKAFQHRQQFEGRSAYKTWFYRVAVNEAHMHLRQRYTKHFVSGLEEFDSLLERQRYNGPDPLQRLLARERRQQLIRAILQLTPKLRGAILKYSMRDRRETTPKLTGNEKSRIFRAIRLLRQKLESTGDAL